MLLVCHFGGCSITSGSPIWNVLLSRAAQVNTRPKQLLWSCLLSKITFSYARMRSWHHTQKHHFASPHFSLGIVVFALKTTSQGAANCLHRRIVIVGEDNPKRNAIIRSSVRDGPWQITSHLCPDIQSMKQINHVWPQRRLIPVPCLHDSCDGYLICSKTLFIWVSRK